MFKIFLKSYGQPNYQKCFFILILCIIIGIFLANCGDDSGTNNTITQAVIGPEGGVLEVTDARSPIFGAKLEVPSGSLDQRTTFSLRYDTSNDTDDLRARPVVVDHDDVVLNEDATLTLPLKAPANDAQSLMMMIYDDDAGVYVPTGLIIDIETDDAAASFQIAHLSSFSLMLTDEALSEDDIDHKRLHSLLARLIIEIETSIENDAGTLTDALDAMLEDHQEGRISRILTEIILSGVRPLRRCTEDVSVCADKLARNTRTLLERLPYVKGINICDELNTGEEIFACFPENSFPFIKCIPAIVSDSTDDDCMGRCGVGCPDADNEFDDLLPCGDFFRYSQACLNHDACVRYHSLLDFRCNGIFSRLTNDCQNEQLSCTEAREICGDAKDNNGNGEIDEGCPN